MLHELLFQDMKQVVDIQEVENLMCEKAWLLTFAQKPSWLKNISWETFILI